MEAYVYCIPLSDSMVRIGSHSGSLKQLDACHGTYVPKDLLAQKKVFRIEPHLRFYTEKLIQGMIKRGEHGNLFVEKEKFKREAEPIFMMYARTFALTTSPAPTMDVACSPILVAVEPTLSAPEIDLIDDVERQFRQMKVQKKLDAIAKYEAAKRAEDKIKLCPNYFQINKQVVMKTENRTIDDRHVPPSSSSTVNEPLLSWLKKPSDENGIHKVAADDKQKKFVRWPDLKQHIAICIGKQKRLTTESPEFGLAGINIEKRHVCHACFSPVGSSCCDSYDTEKRRKQFLTYSISHLVTPEQEIMET